MLRVPSLLRAAVGGVAAAAALALALPAAAQTDIDAEATGDQAPQTKGEKRLAKLLEGREAGEPVGCIRSWPSQQMQTIDGTAYVFGSGSTIYVQRTRNPDQINDNYALVTNRFNGSQLCRLDSRITIDPFLGFFTGAVLFEDFVPYTRAKPAAEAEG